MKAAKSRLIAITVTTFYALGAAFAVEAVMSARTAQGAVAWAVSLASFPFAAVPAYLVFGRSRFEGGVEAYEQRKDEIDGLIAEFRSELEPWQAVGTDARGYYRALAELSSLPMTRGNSAELLIDGKATFDSILEGVAAAEDYVLVQFYMFHDDGLGRRMQQTLIERASAGVRVFFLYDEIGSQGLPKSYLSALRSAGVRVSSFRPTQGARNRFQLNFRNHRKMVVVDGVTGWVGGHNVGDEYLGLDPEFSPWRDTHLRLQGPVVMQLQSVILSDWYWATRELPQVRWQPRPAENSDIQASILPSAPTQRLETAGLMFVTALNAATDRAWISAPYFVPDEAVIKALELAALRGVDVRIITTGKPDSLPVFLAAFYYIDQLRDLGIRFYAYQPGFLHSKVMLIDDHISTVGTANFDNRSFRLNFEVTAVIDDVAFAREMEQMFEADFAHAKIIEADSLDDKPFWWRFGVSLSRLAAPAL
jgi:cardiolipin synthase